MTDDPTRPLLRLADVVFPARDETMAQVVAHLAEPESGPPADNLLSNEDSVFRISDQVRAQAPGGGVYLGVGPDQNFSLIAPSQPKLAFVIDFRRRNTLLHLVHKALLSLADSRVNYLTRLLARLPGRLPADPTAADLITAFATGPLDRNRLAAQTQAVAATLRPLGIVQEDEWPAIATIQARLAGPGLSGRFLALPMYPTFGQQIAARDRRGQPSHFLALEATYQAVRTMQQGDRIIPVVGNFAGSGTLPKLADWLGHRSLAVAVFYLSDVEFFLVRSGQYPRFAAHLARLPWADRAILIRTSTREIPHPDRLPGDSSTTIIRPIAPFLEQLRVNPRPSLDQLFG